jgi:hypothetical protein
MVAAAAMVALFRMQEVAQQRIPIMQHLTSECEVQDANLVKPCIERRVHDENEVRTTLNASQLFRKKTVEIRRPMNFFVVVFSVRLAWSCLNLFLCEIRSRECNSIQVENHREVGKRFAIVDQHATHLKVILLMTISQKLVNRQKKLGSQISDVINLSHSRKHFCHLDCSYFRNFK